jgi:hypothetical protein
VLQPIPAFFPLLNSISKVLFTDEIPWQNPFEQEIDNEIQQCKAGGVERNHSLWVSVLSPAASDEVGRQDFPTLLQPPKFTDSQLPLWWLPTLLTAHQLPVRPPRPHPQSGHSFTARWTLAVAGVGCWPCCCCPCCGQVSGLRVKGWAEVVAAAEPLCPHRVPAGESRV